jgi:hypothetical protein
MACGAALVRVTCVPLLRASSAACPGMRRAAEAASADWTQDWRFHILRHAETTSRRQSELGFRDLIARMGHDNERAAMIYQHEVRGADEAITKAIDAHVQAEQDSNTRDGDEDDGPTGLLAPVG